MNIQQLFELKKSCNLKNETLDTVLLDENNFDRLIYNITISLGSCSFSVCGSKRSLLIYKFKIHCAKFNAMVVKKSDESFEVKDIPFEYLTQIKHTVDTNSNSSMCINSNHTHIKNSANGNIFYYCRDCKKEVDVEYLTTVSDYGRRVKKI